MKQRDSTYITTLQRWILTTALGIFLLTLFLPALITYLVETYYSTRIYPLVAKFLGQASDLVSFSLSEILVGFVACYLIKIGIFHWHQYRKNLGFHSKKLLVKVCTLFCLFYILFYFLWGFNYFRESLADKLELRSHSVSTKEIYTKALDLSDKVNFLYGKGGEMSFGEMSDQLEEQLDQVIFELDGTQVDSAREVKNLQCNFILDELGVDGLILPFFSEAHINPDQFYFEIPFTIAHEKAHLKGYAKEEEASFIGYLACARAKDELLRYSGHLSLLYYLMQTLPPKYQKKIWKSLRKGPRKDLSFMQSQVASSSENLDRVDSVVYHYFLRINGDQKGMGSYKSVAPLLVAYEKKSSLP